MNDGMMLFMSTKSTTKAGGSKGLGERDNRFAPLTRLFALTRIEPGKVFRKEKGPQMRPFFFWLLYNNTKLSANYLGISKILASTGAFTSTLLILVVSWNCPISMLVVPGYT